MDKGKYVWQCAFRCFSPWWALTHLHLKKHSKTHRWQVLCSFVGAEICSAKESPSTILAVWSRGLTQYGRISAPQNRACPRSSVVKSRLANRFQGTKNTLKEDPVMFLDWMLAGSFVLDLVAALAVRASVR